MNMQKDDTTYCEVSLKVFVYYVFMRVRQRSFR